MAISHIIAHRIQRVDPMAGASLQQRENAWIKNGRIEECFRELKICMIKRLGKDYGRFSDDTAAHPLAAWVNEYHLEKISFETFSKKAMEHLKNEFDKTDELLDGFLLFTHEELESAELIHLFIVQHNHGLYIDGSLEMDDSLYLDTDGIRLAAQINLSDLYCDDIHRSSKAITLLRWRGEKGLSDIFTQFIGFAEKVDVAAETEAFLNVVTDYTKDLPEDVAHQTNKHVVDYCLEQNKVGRPVNIAELSKQLKTHPATKHKEVGDSEEDTPAPSLPEFSGFISSSNQITKPEFIPDTTQLRQFIRLSGRNNQLSMSFASSCLGDSIVYDATTDSLTIKDIPARLKARLIKLSQQQPEKES